MDEDIMERRVQARGNSFVLTIPQRIASEVGIKKGQSVRFTMGNGEFTVRPTGIGVSYTGSAKSIRYTEAIDRMMNDVRDENKSEKPSVRPKISKLEKLRIK